MCIQSESDAISWHDTTVNRCITPIFLFLEKSKLNKYDKITEIVNDYCKKARSEVFSDWLLEMYLSMTDQQIDDIHAKIKQEA